MASLNSDRPNASMSSLIGETVDLLVAVDFLADCDFDADFLALLDGVELVFFLMLAGVFGALGLGVPLMAFGVLLAGVEVCLAIMNLCNVFRVCKLIINVDLWQLCIVAEWTCVYVCKCLYSVSV